eukprot:CAMPEP_0115849908 /NCGR_PEP_ID=MMETSP0287-20121206/11693_1 /TAXON_ID=412157 /ORGANISM="Chrysochromulina rotalis, Strain UIO044" /LENGTH=181 /DNA_ID=CAMNT_0003303893 /DNA_START=24 /DNA_END=569 /DNA_ORIENTATION=+
MRLIFATAALLVAASGLTMPAMVLQSCTSRARAPCMDAKNDKTREGEYPHPHDDDYKFGDITKRVIRDMTGNKDYEFGDGTKALSSATQDAAEQAAEAVIAAGGTAAEAGAAARKAIDDSGYQFGDFTKAGIKGFEGAVRDATGNEEYKFGDLSKNLAKGLFGALEKGAAEAKKKIDGDGK